MKWLDWFKRSATRPSPDPWQDGWWYGNVGMDTKTGLEISEDLALTFSAVWSCVKVISEDLSSLPLHVYRRDGRNKERADDHPCYWLLHDQPNPEMTALQFREALQAHLLTWGNAYAEISRDMRGQPIALWPLNPGKMKVTRPEREIIYEYTLENGQKKLFSRENVFHLCGLGFNGLIGYSPVGYQR